MQFWLRDTAEILALQTYFIRHRLSRSLLPALQFAGIRGGETDIHMSVGALGPSSAPLHRGCRRSRGRAEASELELIWRGLGKSFFMPASLHAEEETLSHSVPVLCT